VTNRFKNLGLWGTDAVRPQKAKPRGPRIELAGKGSDLDGHSDECIAFPVPPEVLIDNDGGKKLAGVLMHLMSSGAGNGKYGGRLMLLFPSRGTQGVVPWGRSDVESVCKEALETWPGLLDTLVWEEHPDLMEAVPEEEDRLRLYGRLAFVALAESKSIWKDGQRDMMTNRTLLGEWRTKARRTMA
jgi:hypothetical protein